MCLPVGTMLKKGELLYTFGIRKKNISENFHYRVCQRGHQGSYIYICLIGLNFACQVVELGTTSYVILPISTTKNVTFANLRAIEKNLKIVPLTPPK